MLLAVNIARYGHRTLSCDQLSVGDRAWPYLWLDAMYIEVRDGGRIVSRAVTVAVGVNSDGKREILGIAVGPSEAETFWTDFLRTLADRGLRGVKLVIADDHKGWRAAARRVFNATHQRCRDPWMRNALAHAPAKSRAAVAAIPKTIFVQETKQDARREKNVKLAEMMDASREDVLAYMDFPKERWPPTSSTNPLERLNKEIKRRSDVVGIFPNDDAITRIVDPASSMMPPSGCPPWHPDHPRTRPGIGAPAPRNGT